MITVAERAAGEIRRLMEDQKMEGMNLRLRVVPGGCSGFQYYMGFDETLDPDDLVFEANGVKVVVDPQSHLYLDGAEIDYEEGLMGAGFTIRNPHARGSCGCGSSFSV